MVLPDFQNRRIPRQTLIIGGVAAALVVFSLLVRGLAMVTPFYYHHQDDWCVFGIQSYDMMHGHFRAFMYRQAYIGCLPLMLDSLFFFVLGVNHYAQGAASLVYWCAYLAAAFALARRLFGLRAGLMALGIAALTPKIAFFLSPEPSRGYVEVFALGMALTTLTVGMIGAGKDRLRSWLALGLAGGVGFWISYYTGYFLLPCAVALLLDRPRRMLTVHPYASLVCFLLGSTPYWVFNLVTHEGFPSAGLFGAAGVHRTLLFKTVCFIKKLIPSLGMRFDTPFYSALSLALLCVYVAAVVSLLASFRRTTGRRFFSDPQNAGIFVLLGSALMVCYLNLSSSQYAGRVTLRYVTPLYPFFHLALARLFDGLFEKRRFVFWLAAGLYGLTHLLNLTVQNDRFFNPNLPRAYRSYRATVEQISDFLRSRGARYATTSHKWDAVILSFDMLESGVRILEPESPMSALEALALDAQPEQMRLEPLSKADRFKEILESARFSYEERKFTSSLPGLDERNTNLYNYTLFYALHHANDRLLPISPQMLKVRPCLQADLAPLTTDRILNTGWSAECVKGSAAPWIDVECPRPLRLGRLVMMAPPVEHEPVPGRFELLGSADGVRWTAIGRFTVQRSLYLVRDRLVEEPETGITMLDVQAREAFRFYRIVCRTQEAVWRVNELYLFEAGGPENAQPDLDALVRLLTESKVETVYADEPVTAQLMQRTPLHCFNTYAWDGLHPRRLDDRAVDFSRRTALIVDPAYAGEVAGLLDERGVRYTRGDVAGLAVFLAVPAPQVRDLYWMSLTLLRRFDPEESWRLCQQARRALLQGNPSQAADLAQAAASLFPANMAARNLCAGQNRPVPTAPPPIDSLVPARPRNLLWKGILEISGYTAENGRLRIAADFLCRGKPDERRLVLYGLNPGDKNVAFALESVPTPGDNDRFVCPELREIRPGMRLMFSFTLPVFHQPLELWVCLLDRHGARISPDSADGKPCPGSRVLLTRMESNLVPPPPEAPPLPTR